MVFEVPNRLAMYLSVARTNVSREVILKSIQQYDFHGCFQISTRPTVRADNTKCLYHERV